MFSILSKTKQTTLFKNLVRYFIIIIVNKSNILIYLVYSIYLLNNLSILFQFGDSNQFFSNS